MDSITINLFGTSLIHERAATAQKAALLCAKRLFTLADIVAHDCWDNDITHGNKQCFQLTYPVGATLPCTGAFLYPPGGGQWWHTNSNLPGRRIYAAYSETGESGMVFYKDGKVIVDQDKPGWNVREFVVPCWHAVWAECWRTSYGFNIGVDA